MVVLEKNFLSACFLLKIPPVVPLIVHSDYSNQPPRFMKTISIPLTFLLFLAPLWADPADPAKVDADYAIQGEYSGAVKGKDGDLKLGCQVVAMGKGNFMARGYVGGLPGDGWNLTKEETVNSQKKDDGSLVFENDKHRGILKEGVMFVESLEGKKMGSLKRVARKSPTLGAKPPQGAVVPLRISSPDA